MNAQAPEPVAEHESDETYLVRDRELLRMLGMPEKAGLEALRMLDNNPVSGFPKPQKMWGGRRWWPAVKAYFEAQNQRKMGVSTTQRAPHAKANS